MRPLRTPTKGAPDINALEKWLHVFLEGSEDCVMDEAHLTLPTFRKPFKQFCDTFLDGIEQNWIFFEVDVVACINNVYHDAQQIGRVDLCRYRALDNQRKIYSVPDESEWPRRTVHSVYHCANPRFDPTNESEAVAWLQSEIQKLSVSP